MKKAERENAMTSGFSEQQLDEIERWARASTPREGIDFARGEGQCGSGRYGAQLAEGFALLHGHPQSGVVTLPILRVDRKGPRWK